MYGSWSAGKGFEEAVGVALRVKIINRYFVRVIFNKIDLRKRVYVVLLDYASGILLHLSDTRKKLRVD